MTGINTSVKGQNLLCLLHALIPATHFWVWVDFFNNGPIEEMWQDALSKEN